MEQQNRIYTEESPRTHFTMVPNLIDDAGLDPYAFRLYCHLRRVAGEYGECWRSTATLASECNMSVGKVSAAKQALREAGLIIITEKPCPGGLAHNITIVDVWQANSLHYMNAKSQPSPHETKKNPYKNPNKIEEEAAAHFENCDFELAVVAQLYEQEIGGTLSLMLHDEILELLTECRDIEQWRAAFKASIGKRNRWAYIKAIITKRGKPGAARITAPVQPAIPESWGGWVFPGGPNGGVGNGAE